jgi:hypothetical protein
MGVNDVLSRAQDGWFKEYLDCIGHTLAKRSNTAARSSCSPPVLPRTTMQESRFSRRTEHKKPLYILCTPVVMVSRVLNTRFSALTPTYQGELVQPKK